MSLVLLRLLRAGLEGTAHLIRPILWRLAAVARRIQFESMTGRSIVDAAAAAAAAATTALTEQFPIATAGSARTPILQRHRSPLPPCTPVSNRRMAPVAAFGRVADHRRMR